MPGKNQDSKDVEKRKKCKVKDHGAYVGKTTTHGKPVLSLAHLRSRDKHFMASGCEDGHIRIFNMNEYDLVISLNALASYDFAFNRVTEQLWNFQIKGPPKSLTSKIMQTAPKNLKHHKPEPEMKLRHEGAVRALSFSPCQKVLASGAADGSVILWEANLDLADWPQLKTLPHDSPVNDCVFSPTSDASFNFGMRTDTVSVHPPLTVPGSPPRTNGSTPAEVVFSSSPKSSPGGSPRTTVPATPPLCYSEHSCLSGWSPLPGEQNAVPEEELASASVIATACENGDIKVWSVRLARGEPLVSEIKTLKQGASVHALAFSPGGDKLVSGSDDNAIKVWDTESGNCIKTLTVHDKRVSTLAFSPDGELLASGSHDGHVSANYPSVASALS